MNRIVPICLALLLIPGCGETTSTKKVGNADLNSKTSKLDSDPTILGVGPEMRARLREFLEDSGIGDADDGIEKIMDGMKKTAERMKIQPDADGNYAYPDDLKQAIAEMKAKGGIGKVFDELGLKPPRWAEKAINRSRNGKATPEEEDLLIHILMPTIVAALQS